MKLSKQQTLKMEFNNCMLEIVDGELMIVEYDKNGECVIDEYNLLEELGKHEGFLQETGFKISIARTYGK